MILGQLRMGARQAKNAPLLPTILSPHKAAKGTTHFFADVIFEDLITIIWETALFFSLWCWNHIPHGWNICFENNLWRKKRILWAHCTFPFFPRSLARHQKQKKHAYSNVHFWQVKSYCVLHSTSNLSVERDLKGVYVELLSHNLTASQWKHFIQRSLCLPRT